MVVVLVSGSGAVFALAETSALAANFMMLLTAAIGAVGVVFDLPSRARNHEMLARKFYQTAAKINPEHATDEQVSQWRTDILSAYEDEPAVYHALNAECYNAAAQASGKKTRQRVSTRHHWLRHWFRFSAKDFPKISQEESQIGLA